MIVLKKKKFYIPVIISLKFDPKHFIADIDNGRYQYNPKLFYCLYPNI